MLDGLLQTNNSGHAEWRQDGSILATWCASRQRGLPLSGPASSAVTRRVLLSTAHSEGCSGGFSVAWVIGSAKSALPAPRLLLCFPPRVSLRCKQGIRTESVMHPLFPSPPSDRAILFLLYTVIERETDIQTK